MGEIPPNIRVLYVEDEEVLRDVVSEFLQAVGGYDVQCAENGQEGVDLAISWNPDFILMDVRMPIIDGVEAIRMLRRNSDMVETPIYVVTAFSDEQTLADCERAGSNGHFTKPPNFMRIVSTIKEVIEQKASN